MSRRAASLPTRAAAADGAPALSSRSTDGADADDADAGTRVSRCGAASVDWLAVGRPADAALAEPPRCSAISSTLSQEPEICRESWTSGLTVNAVAPHYSRSSWSCRRIPSS
jgi:hypothetical protein